MMHFKSSFLLSMVFFAGMQQASVAEVVLFEDFSNDPYAANWRYTTVDPSRFSPADPSLVTWNASEGNLTVVWDASQPTSFFQKSLGKTLTENDEITFSFDLVLTESKADPNSFWQLGIGMRRGGYLDFDRNGGTWPPGDKCRDLVEWNYYPPVSSYGGPYVQPTIGTSTGDFRADYSHNGRPLPLGKTLSFTLTYSPVERQILLDLSIDGVLAINDSVEAPLQDGDRFNIDTFGIFIYGDGYTSPETDLIVGTIDNIRVEATVASRVDDFALYE